MWNYYPDLLATPVPRYTSFPTAAEFHDGVGAREQWEGLSRVGASEPVSLYLHIPYCREICWYCGCNTGAANRSARLANYLHRLVQEIALVGGLLDGRGKVARVAFGGGSPNALAPHQFLELVDALHRHFRFADDCVWSIEVDPRGFDQAFAGAIAEAGVTRASLGVQTFDPVVQAAIGRVQRAELIDRSTGWLRDAGVTSLNFDLMYGLPHQDEASLRAGLTRARSLRADRLAVFGYAHIPHLIPRQLRIDSAALPDTEARFRMAALAHDVLVADGWQAIGFDHFARAHDGLAVAARGRTVRRNFQGFTDDRCDTLIGLGASSISRFDCGFIQNEKNAGQYGALVGTGRLAGTRGFVTTPDDRLRALIIEQILCRGDADLAPIGGKAAYHRRLERFERLGLLGWVEDRLELHSGSEPYARAVAASLDPWRERMKERFSSAV